MKKNKAIFLDRDGTINVDFGYVHDKSNLKFIEGAIDGLKKLKDAGYILIIITNQSGIGRKYFTESEYLEFNEYFLNKLKLNGVTIDKVYYCPHIDEDGCDCRKPKLKLFYDAIREFNIDLDNSYAVGDKLRDLAICEETNVRGILLGSNNDKYVSCKDLLEASNCIVNCKN